MPRPRPAPPPRETATPEAGRVLTTALFRAADIAGLSRRAPAFDRAKAARDAFLRRSK